MGAAEKIPWELRAIGAEEVGALLGLAPRTVLETVACRPDFPVRLTMRPATWVAREGLAWPVCRRRADGRSGAAAARGRGSPTPTRIGSRPSRLPSCPMTARDQSG